MPILGRSRPEAVPDLARPIDLATLVWLLLRLCGIYFAFSTAVAVFSTLGVLAMLIGMAVPPSLSTALPPSMSLLPLGGPVLILCSEGVLAYYLLLRGAALHRWILRLVP